MPDKKTAERTAAPYIMASIMLGVSILNTILLSPLFMRIINGFKTTDSLMITLLFYVRVFIPLISNFVGYAFIIHKIIKTSIKDALPYTVLYQAAVFLSLAFSLVWTFVNDGAVPSSDELWYSALSLLLNFVLAAALMYTVVFVCGAIKKRATDERPSTLLPKKNAYLLSALAAAIIETVKQLVIELSYIIPSLFEIGSDITFVEAVSMLISILFVFFVFAAGYLIIVCIMMLLQKRTKTSL